MKKLNAASFDNITRIEYHEQLVLTTTQLAMFYECSADNIRDNFRKNRERFIEGKHFFKLTGDALRNFKSYMANCHVADKDYTEREIF